MSKHGLCNCGSQEDALEAAARLHKKILENQCPVWSLAVGFYLTGIAAKQICDDFGIQLYDAASAGLTRNILALKPRIEAIVQELKEAQENG